MTQKLAETLRKLRAMRGVRLRDVERDTGISNAYLSQLETGKAENPSPHVLYKLAEYYGVPYESLMEEAGYLTPHPRKATQKPVSTLGAALMSAKLSEEEEEKVIEFIEFLRMQRRKRND